MDDPSECYLNQDTKPLHNSDPSSGQRGERGSRASHVSLYMRVQLVTSQMSDFPPGLCAGMIYTHAQPRMDFSTCFPLQNVLRRGTQPDGAAGAAGGQGI